MKRAAALQALSREHNHALVLARGALRAAKSGDASTIRAHWDTLVQAWRETMESHFETEERVVFPILRKLGEAALADRLLREHRALRRTLTDRSRHDAEHLEALADVLYSHVRLEERVAFPLFQDNASTEELAELTEHGNGD